MWFSMPGRALASTENFLEPKIWWVSLIKVCYHWASPLPLSYSTAVAGKVEWGPNCPWWRCVLFGICAISLPAFFPPSKHESLDIWTRPTESTQWAWSRLTASPSDAEFSWQSAPNASSYSCFVSSSFNLMPTRSSLETSNKCYFLINRQTVGWQLLCFVCQLPF